MLSELLSLQKDNQYIKERNRHCRQRTNITYFTTLTSATVIGGATFLITSSAGFLATGLVVGCLGLADCRWLPGTDGASLLSSFLLFAERAESLRPAEDERFTPGDVLFPFKVATKRRFSTFCPLAGVPAMLSLRVLVRGDLFGDFACRVFLSLLLAPWGVAFTFPIRVAYPVGSSEAR